MLKALSDELQFGAGDERSRAHIVESGYRVARELGDSAILRRSEKAFHALEGLRNISSFYTRFREGIHELDGDASGSVHTSHVERVAPDGVVDDHTYLEVSLDVEDIFNGSHRNQAQIRLAAENLAISPAHLDLLTFIRLEAHEAAHVIQRSVEIHMSEKKYRRAMSGAALDKNLGLDSFTDRNDEMAAHDERFAEGYAAIVLAEAARALGYDEQMVGRIKRAYSIQQENIAHNLEDSPSDIGYAQPLSEDEVIGNLEIMTDLLQPGNQWAGFSTISDQESTMVDQPSNRMRRPIGSSATRLVKVFDNIRRKSA